MALITLNPEELAKFAREQGVLTTDPGALVRAPQGRRARGPHRRGAATPNLQSYAKIKKFSILAVDFSLEGGELTPTLKVKRKVVSEKYQEDLEALYG